MPSARSASSERRAPFARVPAACCLRGFRPVQKCLHLPIGEAGGIQMPELRQNFFTKEWVIIATERAKRPEELATHRAAQQIPAYVESCPFCPGNEDKTPQEVLRSPANGEPW